MNEKCQTHKQYRERQGRINIEKKYEKKRIENENEIHDLELQAEQIRSKIEQKRAEGNELKKEEYESLMKVYNNEELLQEIFDIGGKTTFSSKIIRELSQKTEKGFNEDNITIDDLEKIYQLENKIQKEIGHTNIFQDVIGGFGEMIDLGDKEEA